MNAETTKHYTPGSGTDYRVQRRSDGHVARRGLSYASARAVADSLTAQWAEFGRDLPHDVWNGDGLVVTKDEYRTLSR